MGLKLDGKFKISPDTLSSGDFQDLLRCAMWQPAIGQVSRNFSPVGWAKLRSASVEKLQATYFQDAMSVDTREY